jgi:hypothetical protein
MARRKTPAAVNVADDVTTDKPTAQPDRGPATADAQPPARVRVDVDTLVSRPDLGPDARTFVAAGQLILYGLEGYLRTAAS